jgi:hypothetical protein
MSVIDVPQGHGMFGSPAQVARAAERSREVRLHRSAQKVELAAGRLGVSAILADPLCRTMKLNTLLRAIPSLGEVRLAKVMRLLDVPVVKTVGALTDRQKQLLLEVLHDLCPAIRDGRVRL